MEEYVDAAFVLETLDSEEIEDHCRILLDWSHVILSSASDLSIHLRHLFSQRQHYPCSPSSIQRRSLLSARHSDQPRFLERSSFHSDLLFTVERGFDVAAWLDGDPSFSSIEHSSEAEQGKSYGN
ncbi:unnamed protein product [Protopolystoma xenopodis]|uniref:Uncharacterized protein n=1 Tax=Protopolystoma xenopodis TaxID=117903 RepID=A0A3S5C4Z6_9PLAT|nr:unnamed protein product [Protopolystoma xenopodis]